MDQLKKIFTTFFAALLLFAACRPCKELQDTKVIVRDSISYKETVKWRDTVLFTPVDSVAIKALVRCPDGSLINIKPLSAKHHQATAVFEINNGVASIRCKCDSAAIRMKQKETIKETLKERLNEVFKTTTKQVPHVPLFFKIMSAIGGLATVYLIYKLIKIFK